MSFSIKLTEKSSQNITVFLTNKTLLAEQNKKETCDLGWVNNKKAVQQVALKF